MLKIKKLVVFVYFILFVSLFLFGFSTLRVNAADITTLSPTQYETYINGNIKSTNYYSDIESMIEKYFPDFNVSSSSYDQIVNGKNYYKILEITPTSYLGDDPKQVSDISANVELIKGIYKRTIATNDVTGKHFITNMPNFEVDVKTIKEFVDNREQIESKYDAIVFASGNYTSQQIQSCSFVYDTLDLIESKLYYQNNRLRYNGSLLNDLFYGYGELYNDNSEKIYAGTFKNNLYHGNGTIYDGNDNLVYVGGFIEGKKSCFGISYQNNVERYIGQWSNDLYHGYGIEFNEYGWPIYQGYFYHGVKTDKMPKESEILNDITLNKADELLEYYIEKGIPVFFNDDALIDRNSNFYKKFKDIDVLYDNFFVIDYQNDNPLNDLDFYKTLSIMKMTEFMSTKPYAEITKPVDYSVNPEYTYKSNDMLNFTVKLENRDSADLRLFIDINRNSIIEDNEVALAQTIIRGNNTVTFKIPELYNGLLNYKIVINDNLGSFLTEGTIRIRNITTSLPEIKVLNVVSDKVFAMDSLYDDYMFETFFENNGDYKITVDSCTIDAFKKNNGKFECSYETVMDKYDVIFLGQDIFDKTINKHVYQGVRQQITNNKKPIIFSSSFTKGNHEWVEYFGDKLSLSGFQTELYKLTNNVDKLQIINNNNYVLYPYNINNEDLLVPKDLNYAFNEQYQLNLENPALIPLMNMYNSNDTVYDRFDSYNNFYYYKVDNVVYLNVGGNTKNYKEIEHKLIVDAVVNLYVQDKSKGNKVSDFVYITAQNSFVNKLINISEPVNFDFTVNSNKNEEYKYILTVDGVVKDEKDITKNSLVSINLLNFTTANNNSINKVLIDVTVKNRNNDSIVDTYNFYVYVANFSTYNMTYNRNMSNMVEGNYIETGITGKYSLNYTITLKPIDVSYLGNNSLPSSFVLEEFMFTDTLPNDLTVSNTSGLNVSTNASNQTVITKTFSNVTYTLVNNQYIPYVNSTNTLQFSIPIVATKSADYSLANSQVSYDGIGNDEDTYTFSILNFKARNGLNDALVTNNFDEYVFTNGFIDDLRSKFSINLNDSMIKTQMFYLKNYNTSNCQLAQLNLTGYRIEMGNQVGCQNVEMVVTDIFGNVVRREFEVRAFQSIQSIELEDIHVYTNETKTLPLIINPAGINYANLSYKVYGLPGIITLNKNTNSFEISGNLPGVVDIEIYGYDSYGNILTTNRVKVIVNIRLDIDFIDKQLSRFVDEEILFSDLLGNLTILHPLFQLSDVRFKSDSTNITIDDVNGKIVALAPGTAVISAYLPNGSSTLMIVKIFDHLTEDSGFLPRLKDNTMKLYEEQIYSIGNLLKLKPNSLLPDDIEIIYTITDPSGIVEILENNKFKTTGTGWITIHVIMNQYNDANVLVGHAEDTIEVYINELVDPNVDGGDNKH